jgi:2-polyprenyl-6-hydroxyphenyl methylase/3-demethylubiquinone-9 3-methyltransferase
MKEKINGPSGDTAMYWQDYIEKSSPMAKDWLFKETEFLKNNIPAQQKILDVGCGFGRDIKTLASFSKEIIGIDHQPKMILWAKENLSEYKNTFCFLQDAKKIDFSDNCFDIILCTGNTFGNFGNEKIKVLEEMKRVLKGDGKIIISVYSERAFIERLKGYLAVEFPIIKIDGTTCYTEGNTQSEQFTRQQLEELFSQAGLKSKINELNPISYICELTK